MRCGGHPDFREILVNLKIKSRLYETELSFSTALYLSHCRLLIVEGVGGGIVTC